MSDDFIDAALGRRGVLQSLGGAAGLSLLGSATAVAIEERDEAEAAAPGRVRYQLPDLAYGYDALEPHIDERIMELHHGEHHQAYVDGANEALDEFAEMRQTGNFEDIRAAKRDFSFNYSGHVNHTVFWQTMSPNGGGQPDGDLAAALEEQFGSFRAFRDEFSATANEVEGDGWAMLFYEPLADALVIGQVEDQNELAHQAAVPILPLDVWEHAYYLQYENDREAYVEAWWNVVDWTAVEQRYQLLTRARAAHQPGADSEPEDSPLEPDTDDGTTEAEQEHGKDGIGDGDGNANA